MRTGRTRIVALVWLAAAASSGGAAIAQTSVPAGGQGAAAAGAAARGTIRGVVSAAGTGQPLAAAEVRLTAKRSPQVRSGQVQFPRARFTRADEYGRYEFTGIEAGRYTVWASKVGYVALSYGQRLPSEAPANVDLAAGQVLERIDIALLRGAVIAVRVLDAYGDPVSGAVVQAQQGRLSASKDELLDLRPAGLLAATDDRGEMRVFGLAPGEYYISARPGSETRTWYPGTIAAGEALAIAVREGEEIGIAIPLVSSVRAAITGQVLDAAGAPSGDATLRLSRRGVDITGHPIALSPDGTFAAANLPPGDYHLRARSGPRPGGQEFGHVAFRVDEGVDVTGLVVRTKPGATIRGRLLFDDDVPGGERPRPESMSIAPAFTATGGFLPSRSAIPEDWSFTLSDVVGEGVLRVNGPEGWSLKRVVLEGRDVSDLPLDFDEYVDTPVEIHLTRRLTRLTGTAVGAHTTPTVSYIVVAFAEDRRLWTPPSRFVATARPDQTGRYTLTGLPPGRYRVVALNYLPAGTEQDPRILERLAAQATPLTLSEGEARSMDLRTLDRY